MAKPNKDGWIRHRGGKCPLQLGQRVRVRRRASPECEFTVSIMDFGTYAVIWEHMEEDPRNDIMAYKIL